MTAPMEVSKTEDGTRLLRWFLRVFPGLPQREFYKLCRTGQIRLNSKRCRGQEILRTDDVIRIPPTIAKYHQNGAKKAESGERFSLADLEELRQCIIHDDDDIVAFNKPAGLAVQGGTGIRKSIDKMVSALFPYDKMLLVHRLDRETCGVLVVAKNQNAAQILSAQFQDKSAKKEYLALLTGDVSPKSGILDNYMVKGRVFNGDEKFPTDGPRPQRAITEYEELSELKGVLSWVLFKPRTGRTHQLRMHSALVLHAPIVGDNIYGGAEKFDGALGSMLSTKNLFLMARSLSFRHPGTGKMLTIQAELPDYMQQVVKFLEFRLN